MRINGRGQPGGNFSRRQGLVVKLRPLFKCNLIGYILIPPMNYFPIPRSALFLALALGLMAAPCDGAFNPGSNSFGNATNILINGSSDTTNILNFSSEGNEPGHGSTVADNGTLKTAWWSWTATGTGYCTVDTLASPAEATPVVDTVVAVYTGSSVGSLVRVAQNDDSGAVGSAFPGLSSVSFYAVEGTVYKIAVDGYLPGSVTAARCNLVLTARFLPLKKTIRNGLVGFSLAANQLGIITTTMSATGSVSGKLTLGTKSYGFAGAFGVDGYFYTVILQKSTPGAPPITLQIDGTGIGSYTARTGAAVCPGPMLEQLVYTTQIPSPVGGLYTTYTSHAVPGPVGVQGAFSVTVKPTGVVTGVGNGPDGTAITFSSAVHRTNQGNQYAVPIFKSLASGKGAFYLFGSITDAGDTDRWVGNQGIYIRPTSATAFYPDGLLTFFQLLGSTYTKPAAQKRALDFLDGTLGVGTLTIVNSGGELAGDVNEGLTLSTANKFTFTTPLVNKPALTLNPSTGVVTGSITIPPAKKRTIKGVLLLEDGVTPVIRGHVTGVTRTVRFEVD